MKFKVFLNGLLSYVFMFSQREKYICKKGIFNCNKNTLSLISLVVSKHRLDRVQSTEYVGSSSQLLIHFENNGPWNQLLMILISISKQLSSPKIAQNHKTESHRQQNKPKFNFSWFCVLTHSGKWVTN